MERILNDWLITAAYLLAKVIQYLDQAVPFKETQEMVTKTLFWFFNLVLLWLAPIKGALIFTIIIVVIDTVTGIMKAGKDDVSKITSKKSFPMIPKLGFYMSIVLLTQAIHNYVEPELPWVKLALATIAFIEVRSIDENFKAMFGFSFLDKAFEAAKVITKIKRHKDDYDDDEKKPEHTVD